VVVDVILPGSLSLFGANGRFHTAIVAIAGESGSDDAYCIIQHVMRHERDGELRRITDGLHIAAKRAAERRPAC
jgi:hypothetical protein